MSKITAQQAAACTITRAMFSTLWTVVVTDTDGQSYVVKFAGTAEDGILTIRENTYTALIDTEKVDPPVIPTVTENSAVRGTNPVSR